MDTGNAEMSGGKTSICLKDSICRLATVIGSRRSEDGDLEDFYVQYKGTDPPEEEWVTRECLVPLREKRKPTEKRGAPSKWLMKDTREEKDDLEDDLVELQTQFKHLKGQCKLQEQSMSKLSEMASRLDQHLESEFSILQRFLQERKEKLQRELHKDVTEAKRLMDEELKKMREKCQSMEEAVGRITGDNGSSASGKGIQFLTNRCGEGQNTDFPKWSLDKIESRLLGQFRGPVQFAAWRDMRDVLEPGLSCPRLDPGVAHPDLLLSEGHCRISYFPRSWESTLNTPRFTQYLVALGTPKYKSGKHYWELEIGMDTECDIGVSLDTISRNDPFALHPDDGCWVCSIRGDQHIVAFDSSPRIFLQQKKPKRIGIYLGYEEGQISFYNAQTMGHIYTFRATFQGDLRAYISPCSVTDGERCEQLLRVFQQNL
ncbi:hypothetical protein GDO86_018840 [Hymenochirus boettgeri]|uniref:B30.2/SPRY domain-containing protein n=1 Tax=Hymenochirus boettgeri TaxID=247094 RepID=A0A8T2IMK8_9PIPI|nr:hypothetical protein GDO86_018840 [Hymenochirus boettgeri]